MLLEETVVLSTDSVTVTNTFIQMKSPLPVVAIPLAHIVSIHMVAFGNSPNKIRRRYMAAFAFLLALVISSLATSPWTVLFPIIAAVVFVIADTRRRFTVVLRDTSGAEYEIPFGSFDHGIKFFGEFQNHWALHGARPWQASMRFGPRASEA